MNIYLLRVFDANTGTVRRVSLYDGISTKELQAIFNVCFPGGVVGLHDEDNNIYYPLSCISLQPRDFSTRSFGAIFKHVAGTLFSDRTSQLLPASIDGETDLTDSMAELAFRAIDINADNLVQREEMINFLTTAYSQFFENSPNLKDSSITPHSLAASTTFQCFEVSGLTSKDKYLSLDDFCAWYLSSGKANSVRDLAVQAINAYLSNISKNGNSFFYDRDALVKYSFSPEDTLSLAESIEEIQYLTGLNHISINSFLSLFINSASRNGEQGTTSRDTTFTITREHFLASMKSIAHSVGVNNTEGRGDVGVHNLLSLLFGVFDVDGSDFIELADLASALILVCGGSRETNTSAVFNMRDSDRDGFIDDGAMFQHICAIFRLVFHLSKDIRDATQTSPEALTKAQLTLAYEDFDASSEEGISLEEFHLICEKIVGDGRFLHLLAGASKEPSPTNTGAGTATTTSTNTIATTRSESSYNSAGSSSVFVEFEGGEISLADARLSLGLSPYSPAFVIDFFHQYIESGGGSSSSSFPGIWRISETVFDYAMSHLVKRQYATFSQRHRAISDYLISHIFPLFEAKKSGFCNFRELGCGLLVFCGGDYIQLAKAAFSLVGDDGGVSETRMMAAIESVLQVLGLLNPAAASNDHRVGGGSDSPKKTAERITLKAFQSSVLLLGSGEIISEEDFIHWFSVVLQSYAPRETSSAGFFESSGDAAGTCGAGSSETHTHNGNHNSNPNYYYYSPERRSGGFDDTPEAELSIDIDDIVDDEDCSQTGSDNDLREAPSEVVTELRCARELMGFETLEADVLMELLSERAAGGVVTLENWLELLRTLSERTHRTTEEEDEVSQGVLLGTRIFYSFDTANDGSIPFVSFCSGLVSLTDSPIEDKLMVAFTLWDDDNDRAITSTQFENLILSHLRVISACSQIAHTKIEESGISLEELAAATVAEGLAVMNLSEDDDLDINAVSEISFKCVSLSCD